MQRSRMKRWRRRVITDKKEIDVIEHEQKDDFLRVQLDRKADKERWRWDGTEASQGSRESQEGWTPPESFRDFYAMARECHPEWRPERLAAFARLAEARAPVVNRAFLDGLEMGRDLNERTRAGLGWLPWPSLEECTPMEREFIVSKIKKVIERNVSV